MLFAIDYSLSPFTYANRVNALTQLSNFKPPSNFTFLVFLRPLHHHFPSQSSANVDLEKGWVPFFRSSKTSQYIKFVQVFYYIFTGHLYLLLYLLTPFNMVSNMNNSKYICRIFKILTQIVSQFFRAYQYWISRLPHTPVSMRQHWVNTMVLASQKNNCICS